MNAIEQFKKGRVIRCQNPSGPLNMGPKKKLSIEEQKQVTNKVPKEKGMSGTDPLVQVFVGYMGGRAATGALAAFNRIRALEQGRKAYKQAREWNDQTRDASRAWKMKDADKYARNYSGSDNPLGWLYDQFGRPAVNFYDKLNQHPIIGLLIP